MVGVHVCRLDRQCRDVHAPNRLHIWTPWLTVTVALERDGRLLATKAMKCSDGKWRMPPRPWKYTWVSLDRPS